MTARVYQGYAPDGSLLPTAVVCVRDNLTLELPYIYLRELTAFDYPIIEESAWQQIMQSDAMHTSEGVGNNRSDIKITIDSLGAQLRAALVDKNGGKPMGKVDLRHLFKNMDSDHDSLLDKAEFLAGCTKLGVDISPREVNLLWPVFDTDGNGFIDTDEFCAFLHARHAGRRSSTEMVGLSSALRKERIKAKSEFGSKLSQLVVTVRADIRAVVKQTGTTQEQLFVQVRRNAPPSSRPLPPPCRCRLQTDTDH